MMAIKFAHGARGTEVITQGNKILIFIYNGHHMFPLIFLFNYIMADGWMLKDFKLMALCLLIYFLEFWERQMKMDMDGELWMLGGGRWVSALETKGRECRGSGDSSWEMGEDAGGNTSCDQEPGARFPLCAHTNVWNLGWKQSPFFYPESKSICTEVPIAALHRVAKNWRKEHNMSILGTMGSLHYSAPMSGRVCPGGGSHTR